MALYLMLTTLTEKGVQTLNSNPARVREVNRDVEELGAKILHQWASLGAYDFVNVVEAPDDLHDRQGLGRARRPGQLEDRVAAARLGRRAALLARAVGRRTDRAVRHYATSEAGRARDDRERARGEPSGRDPG